MMWTGAGRWSAIAVASPRVIGEWCASPSLIGAKPRPQQTHRGSSLASQAHPSPEGMALLDAMACMRTLGTTMQRQHGDPDLDEVQTSRTRLCGMCVAVDASQAVKVKSASISVVAKDTKVDTAHVVSRTD